MPYYVRKRVPKLNRQTRVFTVKAPPPDLSAVITRILDQPEISVWEYRFSATQSEIRGQYATTIERDAGRRLNDLGIPDSIARSALQYAVNEAFFNGHQHGAPNRPIVVRYEVTWRPDLPWRCVTVTVTSRLRKGQRVGFQEPLPVLFGRRRGNGIGLVRDASDNAQVTIRNGDFYEVTLRKLFDVMARSATA